MIFLPICLLAFSSLMSMEVITTQNATILIVPTKELIWAKAIFHKGNLAGEIQYSVTPQHENMPLVVMEAFDPNRNPRPSYQAMEHQFNLLSKPYVSDCYID